MESLIVLNALWRERSWNRSEILGYVSKLCCFVPHSAQKMATAAKYRSAILTCLCFYHISDHSASSCYISSRRTLGLCVLQYMCNVPTIPRQLDQIALLADGAHRNIYQTPTNALMQPSLHRNGRLLMSRLRRAFANAAHDISEVESWKVARWSLRGYPSAL